MLLSRCDKNRWQACWIMGSGFNGVFRMVSKSLNRMTPANTFYPTLEIKRLINNCCVNYD